MRSFYGFCDLVKIGGTGWTNGATDRLRATLDVAPEEGLHNQGRRSWGPDPPIFCWRSHASIKPLQ